MNNYDIASLTAGLPVPEKYAVHTVRPTAVTPVIDGRITAEEWGDTPDFRLDTAFTGGKRTYCLDHYSGAGKLLAAMDCFWRYDDEYVYLALRLREPEYDCVPGIRPLSVARAMTVHLGAAYFRLIPEVDHIVNAVGNMYYAYSAEDGVQCFEMAAPRTAVTGGRDAFLGYLEFAASVMFQRDTGASGICGITTRTTPMYEDESCTHDVFVLAEGKPAPAPAEAYTFNITYNPTVADVKLKDGLTLRFSDPTVLEQGQVGDQIWGHYQFPSINRLSDGSLRAGWTYSRDTIEYKHEATPTGVTHCISHDEGKTWEYGGKLGGCYAKNLMPNGKYFTGFTGKGAYKADYINKYTPPYTHGGYKMFFAEDIEETVDKIVTAHECDPKTGETNSFEAKINWPYMPLVVFPGGLLYPSTQIFALSAGTVTTVDGVMYMPLYFHGFDSFAPTREAAITPESYVYSLYFFKSADCGRTWDLLSQISVDEHITGYAEGPCEPEMTVAPDGSFVMLFRTGSNNPCYIVRSTDRGVTWSTPRRFDRIGVLPQILTLGCGVTIASYGRPTMRFAATDDPAAIRWEEPIDFPVCGGANQSCFYTDLFPLDDHNALFIYTDFMYPNKDGVPARAVLVRKVTVLKD